MLLTLSLMLLGAPQLPRLREDSVIYEIDPTRFGTGIGGDTELDSIVTHIDYITSLGVSAVNFATSPATLKNGDPAIDAVRGADLGDLLPLGATVSPKSVTGWMASSEDLANAKQPPGKWMGGFSADDAHKLVHPGGLSTVSDDRWRKDIIQFLRDQNVLPSQFEKTMDELRKGYGNAADWLLLSLTPPTGPRIKSALHGDIKELAQVWALLFTLPGIPVLEYGDEIGMASMDDPMNWDQGTAEKTYLGTIQSLITMRRQRPSLYRGSYDVIVKDDENHIFGFERRDRLESTLAFFNNSDKPWSERISMARYGINPMNDLLNSGTSTGQSLIETIYIPAHGVVVIGN